MTIFYSILSSTFIAAIVSGLMSIFLKKLDYKIEYKKDKVKRSLENFYFLESILLEIEPEWNEVNTTNYDGNESFRIFYNEDMLNTVLFKLKVLKSKRLFLNDVTFTHVSKLYEIIDDSIISISKGADNKDIAENIHHDLKKIIINLRESIEKDYKEIDIMRIFKKR